MKIELTSSSALADLLTAPERSPERDGEFQSAFVAARRESEPPAHQRAASAEEPSPETTSEETRATRSRDRDAGPQETMASGLPPTDGEPAAAPETGVATATAVDAPPAAVELTAEVQATLFETPAEMEIAAQEAQDAVVAPEVTPEPQSPLGDPLEVAVDTVDALMDDPQTEPTAPAAAAAAAAAAAVTTAAKPTSVVPPDTEAPLRPAEASRVMTPLEDGEAAPSRLVQQTLFGAAVAGNSADGNSADGEVADAGRSFFLLEGEAEETPVTRPESAVENGDALAAARRPSPPATATVAVPEAPTARASAEGGGAIDGVAGTPREVLIAQRGTVVVKADVSNEPALVERLQGLVRRAVRRGEGRLRIELDPPALGRVDVDVRVVRERLEVQIQVDSETVRDVLVKHLAELERALATFGYDQQGVSVDLRQQDEGGNGSNSALHGGADRTEEEDGPARAATLDLGTALGGVLDLRG